MLLWQPQSFSIRTVFAASLVMHALACFSLFFVYKDYHQRLFIDLSHRVPSQAVVKLLPLSASRPATQKLGISGGKGAVPVQTAVSKQKKAKAPTTLAKQSVISPAKKSVQKKAKVAAKTKKKEVPQKISKQKQLQEEKVKEVIQPPKEESKPVEPVAQKTESAVAQQPVPETKPFSAGASGPEGQEIVYLTKQEFDALQIQQKLQACLFDLWTPPAGIPAGVFCEVLISIGWDGAIVATEFLKKTGILMYDLSVQETLEQVVFPHEVWGKQITIAFKP